VVVNKDNRPLTLLGTLTFRIESFSDVFCLSDIFGVDVGVDLSVSVCFGSCLHRIWSHGRFDTGLPKKVTQGRIDRCLVVPVATGGRIAPLSPPAGPLTHFLTKLDRQSLLDGKRSRRSAGACKRQVGVLG